MAEINVIKILLLNCLLLVGSSVFGHPLPSTQIHLQIKGKRILGTAIMPADEAGAAMKQPIIVEDLNIEFLKNYFQKHIKIDSKTQTWAVKIKSFDSFKEDDRKQGGHHGIIPFLIVHFEIEPNNGNVLEPFIFNYDAIIHEVMTHDVDVYQVFKKEYRTDKLKLGRITIDVKTETFSPMEIRLGKDYQKSNWWWWRELIFIGAVMSFVFYFFYMMKKGKNT